MVHHSERLRIRASSVRRPPQLAASPGTSTHSSHDRARPPGASAGEPVRVRHAHLLVLERARRAARAGAALPGLGGGALPAAAQHGAARRRRVPPAPRRALRGRLPRAHAAARRARPRPRAARAAHRLQALQLARVHARARLDGAAAAQRVLRGRRPVAPAAAAHDAGVHVGQAEGDVPADRGARRAAAGARSGRRRRRPSARRARPHGALHHRLHRRRRLRARRRLARRRRLRVPQARRADPESDAAARAGRRLQERLPAALQVQQVPRAGAGGRHPVPDAADPRAARPPALGPQRLHGLPAGVAAAGAARGGVAGARARRRLAGGGAARAGRRDGRRAGVHILRGRLRDLLLRDQLHAAPAGVPSRGSAEGAAGHRSRAREARRRAQLRRDQGDDLPGLDVQGGHEDVSLVGLPEPPVREELHHPRHRRDHRPRREGHDPHPGAPQRPAVLRQPERVPAGALLPGGGRPPPQVRVPALRRRTPRLHRRAPGPHAVAGGAGRRAGPLRRAAGAGLAARAARGPARQHRAGRAGRPPAALLRAQPAPARPPDAVSVFQIALLISSRSLMQGLINIHFKLRYV